MLSGRYSNEKRQDLLIKAVEHSKYRDKIQIILAGNGPTEKTLRKLGKTLPNPPIMCFLSKDELIEVINFCDLYVHCSDIEIEGDTIEISEQYFKYANLQISIRSSFSSIALLI